MSPEFQQTLLEEPSTAALQAKCQEGLALHRQGKIDEAEHVYLTVLQCNPTHFLALHLLGLITAQRRQIELRHLQDALASCDKAIARRPDDADGYVKRGIVLERLDSLEDALTSYKTAIALKPDYEFLSGALLFAKMQICEFANVEREFAQLFDKIMRSEKASRPFPTLAMSSSLQVQRKAAEIWIRNRQLTGATLPTIPKRPSREKICIGYFSADYHNHATMYLMAGMLEKHDRSRFELLAFSFGPESNDEMRRRVAPSFDVFTDVRTKSDKEVALLSRKLEVDIAVDLKGLTADSRPDIFNWKAAPIQVQYLGYPGTMGAKYIDYIIADKVLIPEDHKQHYCEKIAYLPNSYQVNDSKRSISDKRFNRAHLGLPPTGFVFCCFNNPYKLTPCVFDCWMRILRQVAGSALWLFADNATARRNLRKEAAARGVSAERLIFAERLPQAEHLGRYQSADLFLDTLPYNAHTTASDALWAGLPVLTCLGQTFAGRVAASLLHSIDLPELITTTPEAYESLAIELATHPDRLNEIKQKLAKNRLTKPLFDTELFTKHIQTAYIIMYDRYHSGSTQSDIYVPN